MPRRNKITPIGMAVQQLNGYLLCLRSAEVLGQHDQVQLYRKSVEDSIRDIELLGADIEFNQQTGRYRKKYAPKIQVSAATEMQNLYEGRINSHVDALLLVVSSNIDELAKKIHDIQTNSSISIENGDFSFVTSLNEAKTKRATYIETLSLLTNLKNSLLEPVKAVYKETDQDLEEDFVDDEVIFRSSEEREEIPGDMRGDTNLFA